MQGGRRRNKLADQSHLEFCSYCVIAMHCGVACLFLKGIPGTLISTDKFQLAQGVEPQVSIPTVWFCYSSFFLDAIASLDLMMSVSKSLSHTFRPSVCVCVCVSL